MATKNASGLYEENIDGKTYWFEKWGAEDSLDTLLDIAGIAGKPLGMLLGGALSGEGASLLDRKFDSDVIGKVMESLFNPANKQTAKALIKKLSSGDKVFCEGVNKLNFNSHYEDKLDHLFKVTKAALEVQYGNFFDALLKMVPKDKLPKNPLPA
jgi:hypothetical protein